MTEPAVRVEGRLDLASFPEQNPNPVIEIDAEGHVAYVNPIGAAKFPDLIDLGREHPLLAGLEAAEEVLRRDGLAFVSREVDVGDGVFEQKVCPLNDERGPGLRIFVHDVTALHRAHEAIGHLARRVLDAQEDERRRISSELHDDTGQALTALRISLGLLADEPPSDAEALRRELVGLREIVDETRDRIRRLALGLRPSLLDVMDISEAVRAECDSFGRRAGLLVTCEGQLPRSVEGAAATAIFRFVQEGLNNVVKHARAGRVVVRLAELPDGARVELFDDGSGFDLDQARLTPGIGLRGLQERFALLGGAFDVHCPPEGGTRLVGTLPALDEARVGGRRAASGIAGAAP